ncbi:hypothetical protein GGI43DRAFT_350982 [Trichoderma evansii]
MRHLFPPHCNPVVRQERGSENKKTVGELRLRKEDSTNTAADRSRALPCSQNDQPGTRNSFANAALKRARSVAFWAFSFSGGVWCEIKLESQRQRLKGPCGRALKVFLTLFSISLCLIKEVLSQNSITTANYHNTSTSISNDTLLNSRRRISKHAPFRPSLDGPGILLPVTPSEGFTLPHCSMFFFIAYCYVHRWMTMHLSEPPLYGVGLGSPTLK